MTQQIIQHSGIKGLPEETVDRIISQTVAILAAMRKKTNFGGNFVIHEANSQVNGSLRCWNFQFGHPDERTVMECSEECMELVVSFLSKPGVISSAELGLDPGGVCNLECGLILVAQGLDPLENEALAAMVAFQAQWISSDFLKEILSKSNNILIGRLHHELELEM